MVAFPELKVGQVAKILKINTRDRVYRQRLLAMGLLPGAEFLVKRRAPLGDPVEVVVRGFSLSLRKKEANILEVEVIHEGNNGSACRES